MRIQGGGAGLCHRHIYQYICIYIYLYIYIYSCLHVGMFKGIIQFPGGAYVWEAWRKCLKEEVLPDQSPGFAGMGSVEVCVTDDK